MIDLLDINVWLSLADENHQHHRVAREYWEGQSAPVLNFCRVTMLGFLRLSTHAKAMGGHPFTPCEAWSAYRNFTNLPEVGFLPESESLEEIFANLSEKDDFAQALWTDAYLAALAIGSRRRLVSFDRDFSRFKSLDFLHLGGSK